MDYRHWIKITEHFKVRTIDRVLAHARYDEGSISFSHAKAQQEEAIAISKEYWGSYLHPMFYKFLFSYLNHRYSATERLGFSKRQ
jgi:hypothetical protein